MTTRLENLRNCFEGAVPSPIATCGADGTPNVAYLSQVHYVDESHVALTYQFFNTTRRNILANPRATVQVVDPDTAAHYRLHLEYLRTETKGPLFENMKAKLAGIASHTGMSKVFRLLGSDIYRVVQVEHVFGEATRDVLPRTNRLAALRACVAALGSCGDLAHLFDQALQAIGRYCHIEHAMLLIHDERRHRLYTVATRGYVQSGVGSEVSVGEGIIGVAARERTPIRIGYAASDYLYGRVMREGFARATGSDAFETEIPFPGLPDSGSQLAVPITFGSRLFGVLFVESAQETRFTYEDEDALVVLANQLACSMELLAEWSERHEEGVGAPPPATVQGAPVAIRHFAADHSIFVDNDYLVKGVAGAILRKIVGEYVTAGRTGFTNRELRLDPTLGLPDITDNLEARLILLQRRLAERCPFLAIEKAGRGRFHLRVTRPLTLTDAPGR